MGQRSAAARGSARSTVLASGRGCRRSVAASRRRAIAPVLLERAALATAPCTADAAVRVERLGLPAALDRRVSAPTRLRRAGSGGQTACCDKAASLAVGTEATRARQAAVCSTSATTSPWPSWSSSTSWSAGSPSSVTADSSRAERAMRGHARVLVAAPEGDDQVALDVGERALALAVRVPGEGARPLAAPARRAGEAARPARRGRSLRRRCRRARRARRAVGDPVSSRMPRARRSRGQQALAPPLALRARRSRSCRAWTSLPLLS